ncbi:MAG: two-component regulator propeller domain-containing protein [Ignavibacteria bacterium]
MKKLIFALAVLMISVCWVYSQNPEFITYTTSNSILRSNFITAIAKEADNTIWVGTFSHTVTGLGGTVKITGNGWSLFDTTNSGIKNNTAGSIVIDNNNNKWFGCSMKIDGFTSTVLDSGGYSRLSGSTWSNWQNNLFWSDNIQDLSIDRSNNNLWSAVGTFFIQGSPIHGTVGVFNGSSWSFFTRAFLASPITIPSAAF